MKVTKIIKLTKGQITLIDLEDAPLVGKYKWHAAWNLQTKSFYAMTAIGRIKPYVFGMSRLIMGLERGDKRQVDHINHDTLDNRKENLRVVTNQQNCQNRRGVKGYSWDKKTKKWKAKIRVNSKAIHLGRFNIESAARQAYLDARKKYGFIDTNE